MDDGTLRRNALTAAVFDFVFGSTRAQAGDESALAWAEDFRAGRVGIALHLELEMSAMQYVCSFVKTDGSQEKACVAEGLFVSNQTPRH